MIQKLEEVDSEVFTHEVFSKNAGDPAQTCSDEIRNRADDLRLITEEIVKRTL